MVAVMEAFENDASWYVARGEQQFGPISWRHVQKLFEIGKIEPDDFLWSAEVGDWKLASKLLGSEYSPKVVEPPSPKARIISEANLLASSQVNTLHQTK